MAMLGVTFLLSLAAYTHAVAVDYTVMEAVQKLRLHTLTDLLQSAGLDTLLDDPSANLTLFAPTDRAISYGLRNLHMSINDVKANQTELQNFLKYHVVPGLHKTADLNNERIFTTASGEQLRTNHYLVNNQFYVDGARIVNRNIECKNGVIHVISGVLIPFEGDVYDVISNTPELSTLKAAIDTAGLGPTLKDQNPITIFCPNNDAFAKLGDDLVQKLLANPTLLKEILLYHVIPGSLYGGALYDTSLHTFEEKDMIVLNHHGNYDEVDNARFTDYDISASNGVLHQINHVLVPSSLEDQIKQL